MQTTHLKAAINIIGVNDHILSFLNALGGLRIRLAKSYLAEKDFSMRGPGSYQHTTRRFVLRLVWQRSVLATLRMLEAKAQ